MGEEIIMGVSVICKLSKRAIELLSLVKTYILRAKSCS